MSSRNPKKHSSSKGADDRSVKRTRFEEPIQTDADRRRRTQADATADEKAFDEQILADLEGPSSSTRRKAVKVEGYETDSSDDGESVVRSRKNAKNAAAEDDDDMFAPTAGPSSSSGGKDEDMSNQKEEKFLELGDIEGQEFAGDAAGDDIDDNASDQFEDEDARERKAKEGMGFELSSFNMKTEMEEGKFAEDGTFHRSFDPHAVHDKWMDGIDDSEIRKARKVKKKMEENEKARIRAEEEDAKSKDQISKRLVSMMGKGETVLEALQRLGKEAKANSKYHEPKKWKGRGEAANAVPSVSSSMAIDDTSTTTTPPAEVSAIDEITSLASTLLSLGDVDIYEETYESLLRTVRRSGVVAPDWTPPPAVASDIRYEYKWSPAYIASTGGQASATQVYGPHTKEELEAWRDASYFGDSGERIQIRRIGQTQWYDWSVVA